MSSRQLPLEVEISLEEPFSNCYYTRTDEFSDLGKSGLFGGDLDLLGEKDEGFDENFQSLNSPFDWEVDEEFFKAELEAGDCKSNGPTLAELNGERSRSPLINPEMERLHRVATRTDEQTTSSAVTKSVSPPQRLFEPKVSVEVFRPQVNRTCENVKGGKENNAIEFGERFGRVVVKEEKSAKEHPVCSTASTEIVPRPISDSRFGKIVPERIEKTQLNFSEERKLDGQQSCSIPNLVSPEMKLRLLSSCCPHADIRGQDQESDEAGEAYNGKMKIEPEESEDEEMDSYEEDFEEDNDNEEHEEFIYSKSRKGRRGDCDDLEPNPRRLLDIGRELERLNRIIGDLKPIHQLPVNARNKSRKEKNKLASRFVKLNFQEFRVPGNI